MRNGFILALAAAAASPSLAATPEVRGTWLTTTNLATGMIRDAATTNTTMQRLRAIGLNSTYMDTWRNGNTQFPSPTMLATIGRDRDLALGTRDPFSDTLIAAHRNQMAQIGWFQYGFMSSFGNPTASTTLSNWAQARGYLLQDASGAYTNAGNSYTWMNPAVPQVRQLLINVILDAVNKYDLDGIQIDDHTAWPVEFGFDNTTRDLYLAETGRALPASHTDTLFKQWRASKVTQFAQELYVAVKQRNPNLIVSASPSIYSFSYDNYLVDWPTWSNTNVMVNGVSTPLFDEYVPQVYRSTSSSFTTTWNQQLTSMNSSRRGDLLAGISINSGSTTLNWNTVNQPQVNTVRNTNPGVGGHVWWYGEGVLTDEAVLTTFYNVAGLGQANRPDQAAGWRPAPTVATSLGSNQWRATPGTSGVWRIIYLVGSQWTQLDSRQLAGGVAATFTLPAGATQVEIIPDRRPLNLVDPKWSNGLGGTWNTVGNWVAGVPNFAGSTAVFSNGISTARTVTVDAATTTGYVLFNNATASYTLGGTSTLTLQAAAGNATLTVAAGSHSITAPLALASNTTADIALATTLTIGNISGTGVTLTKTNPGTLAATRINGPGVTLSGGTLRLTDSAGGVNGSGLPSVLASLSVAAGTTLDIRNNDAIVRNATAALATYQARASQAYNNGLWDGAGITSTRAATDGLALAIATNADLGYSAFGTVGITTNDVLIKYTWFGDADLNGQVDGDDYLLWLAVFGSSGTGIGWAQGDFDYDTEVDGDDYLLWLQNFGNGIGSPLGSVPEPGTAGVAALAGAGLLARRRRCHTSLQQH